jgi:hypothetical protein
VGGCAALLIERDDDKRTIIDYLSGKAISLQAPQ